MPGPGEPLFLPEDTDAVMALAEEERDTCPKCGLPKAWCRDNANGRARFDVAEEFCWATYRVALRNEAKSKKAHPATMHATQLAARFREGKEPDVAAGLGIDLDGGAGG